MIQRRNFLVVAMGAVLALFGLAAFDSHRADAKDPQVEGKLAAMNVSARVASIKITNGTIVKVTIPTTAKVERNGFKVALSAFKVGDRVQAKFLADGVTVFKFEGTGL